MIRSALLFVFAAVLPAQAATDLSAVAFPIQVNEQVEDWMYRYLTTQRNQFQLVSSMGTATVRDCKTITGWICQLP